MTQNFDEVELDENSSDLPKSKSQVKRDLLALQDLAKELVELPEKRLASIPVSETVLSQILKAKTFKRIHLKRQLRFIGGLLENEAVDDIREALHALLTHQSTQTAEHHQTEHWRDRLLVESGTACLTEIVEQHPQVDSQRLRQLVRAAKKEQELILKQVEATGVSNTKKVAFRKLFRFLRELSV